MADEYSRRDHLKLVQSATAISGLGAVAGCLDVGGDNGDGETTFTVGEIASEENNCMDCVSPTPSFALPDIIEEESDGELVMDLQPENQVCDTSDCGSSAQSGVVASGYASIGNSTAFFPENQIFLVPYTFPSRETMAHSVFHPEVWENYWVPFAQQYNIFPFYSWTPALRQVLISEAGTEAMDGEDFRSPEQLEGLTIRRTESRVAQEALETWGASPDEVSWEDTIQGMETGVVDGLETWSSVAIGAGMGDVIDQVVHIDWKAGYGMQWVNTDWLAELSEEHRQIIADATRQVTEEAVHQSDEVIYERVGEQDPPPEGSHWDELGVNVNILDDDELQEWREPLDPMENPDKWDPEKELITDFDGMPDGDEFYDTLYDIAREDGAPDNDSDFTIDAWWDDYLDDI